VFVRYWQAVLQYATWWTSGAHVTDSSGEGEGPGYGQAWGLAGTPAGGTNMIVAQPGEDVQFGNKVMTYGEGAVPP
jgi:hypothetical protein